MIRQKTSRGVIAVESDVYTLSLIHILLQRIGVLFETAPVALN